MRGSATQALVSLIATGLIGCGGAQTTPTATAENEADDPPPASEPPSPEAPPELVPEPEEDVMVAEPEPEPATRPIPITPGSAEDLHQAILAATHDEASLRRLIDPVWGIGTHDPGSAGSGVLHHCEVDAVVAHAGVAFSVGEDDRWRCDRDLRRCQASSRDGGGYVFHFRSAVPGGAVWLSAIIHHARTVPNRDSAAIRNYVQAGDGVCDLWRAITDEDHPEPRRFSVFVGGHTGLVPETVTEHHCGDEARQAFARQIQTIPRGQTYVCGRNPTRCSIASGNEEYTLYGGPDGALAIATTRPGMFQNLEAAQQREVASFLRAFRNASCD